MFMRFLRSIFGFLASVKLAVFTLLGLVGALTAATFIEAEYDTATAQYFIYRSGFFYLFLAFLGVNILCSALSRLPWRRKHIAFLLAHAGILILLAGSWITSRSGVDGSLRVAEGNRESQVEIADDLALLIQDPERSAEVKRIPIQWTPPFISFQPRSLASEGPWDLRIEEFLSHADLEVQFVPDPEAALQTAAVHFAIQGGPMRIRQEYWIWQGDAGWSSVSAGPAWVGFNDSASPAAHEAKKAARVSLTFGLEKNSLRWRALNTQNSVRTGIIALPLQRAAGRLDPGWKQVSIEILEVIPKAQAQTQYRPARVQYGQAAPSSAIRIATGAGESKQSLWLGLGDRAVLKLPAPKLGGASRSLLLGYYPRRVVLPFAIELDRFTIERYAGTQDPASFSSRVRAFPGQGPSFETEISMNEPLQLGGYTVYQASYEDARPRPTVSIFSVNRDPGRAAKYLGSALIVLGTIWLFASRFQKKTKKTPIEGGVSTA